MFLHAVYFWLKDDLTTAQRADFARGVHTLPAIPVVSRAHIGEPAATNRPVIDSSYSYALVLEFADQAAQDSYQEHPVHLQFVQDCHEYWTRVQIYDSVG
ncbi:MAG TPA: Dabb family protein [Armatimonadota bacterium]|jgi:hypothetical protein